MDAVMQYVHNMFVIVCFQLFYQQLPIFFWIIFISVEDPVCVSLLVWSLKILPHHKKLPLWLLFELLYCVLTYLYLSSDEIVVLYDAEKLVYIYLFFNISEVSVHFVGELHRLSVDTFQWCCLVGNVEESICINISKCWYDTVLYI